MPEVLQCHRGAVVPRKVIDSLCSIAAAQRSRDAPHRVGCRGRVVCEGVRQNDRVRLRVREIEAAAKRMTELMVQRHADVAQHRSGEPSSIQRLSTRSDILRIGPNAGKSACECANAFLGYQAHVRIGIARIQALSGVCDGVDTTGDPPKCSTPEDRLRYYASQSPLLRDRNLASNGADIPGQHRGTSFVAHRHL
jgi:hypothetical protein